MLFEPISLCGLNIDNRFVRSATHEWLAEEDGTPTSSIGDLYEELAKNDVGLIITGYSYVNIRGKSADKQQAIYSDRFIQPYREITARIHKYKSKIMLQIVHGGRQSLITSENTSALAPSRVPDSTSTNTLLEMTEDEIYQTIDDFALAAGRASKAGFDGVQLHCAHGFLLSNFLSPYTNRRNDQWGRSTENRTRIVTEIIERIHEDIGKKYPIMIKLNATDGFDPSKVSNSLDMPECIEIAKELEKAGACAIEVSGGIFEAGDIMSQPHINSKDREAYFRRYSRAIKDEVNIPIILVGGIRSLTIMNEILHKGYADMISMSRPFIKEPDLVKKLKYHDQKSAQCISCNLCFDDTGIKCNCEI